MKIVVSFKRQRQLKSIMIYLAVNLSPIHPFTLFRNLKLCNTRVVKPVQCEPGDRSEILVQILKSQITDYIEHASSGKPWPCLVKNPVPRGLSRAVGVAAFRAQPGHGYLASHLHMIAIAPSPECGHQKMDARMSRFQ